MIHVCGSDLKPRPSPALYVFYLMIDFTVDYL